MTEQEYITVKELGLVKAAKWIIRDITPEISEVIRPGDYHVVMVLLSEWETKLHEKINIIN